MIKEALYKVIQQSHLSEEEAYGAVCDVLEGKATPSQIAAFLTGLRLRGASVDEVIGAARAFQERAPRLSISDGLIVIDREEINLDEETIIRTALWDKKGTRTFNISTATAFVVAGAGVRVAKSGNMAPTDFVGSGHVLRALGIELDITTSLVERCVEDVGIGFFYTPMLQGVWRRTFEVQSQMGFRTLFNQVGPLCNPAGARIFFLGVYEPDSLPKMAQVLQRLRVQKGTIVHGEDSLDEVSITGKSLVCQLDGSEITTHELVPEDLGLDRATPEDIRGGDARENARIVRAILDGEPGARRDIVLFSSSMALVTAGRAASLPQGLEMAQEAIDSGEARRKLEAIVSLTNESGYIRVPSSYA